MRAAMIGFEAVGKKTLMEAFMGADGGSPALGKKSVTTIRVPDKRIDKLSGMFNPEKTTYSHIELVLDDHPGRSMKEMLESVRAFEVLILVARGFDPQGEDAPNPMVDVRNLMDEMILGDLIMIEKRLDFFNRTHDKGLESQVLEKCAAALNDGRSLSTGVLDDNEKAMLGHYNFLTLKPILIAFNVEESLLGDPELAKIEKQANDEGLTGFFLSAPIEAEIAKLPAEDQQAFLEDIGQEEGAAARLVRGVYAAMSLISFFTVGEDEVRAWPVRRDSKAPVAAGRIHSDLQRGFIRAETVAYEDFLVAGSTAAAKRAGSFRSEGKEYVVKDGDIINFLFKV